MKQTEIGLIPDDWEVKEFNQVATLINGRAYSQSELLKQGKYKVLRVGNFGTNDTWYYSNLELPEKQYCNKGDLLYCWSCTYGAYIWNEDDTIYHYHIWKIQTNNADKYYLKYILNNDIASQMSNSNGSTMAHITKGFLEKRRFVFPPFEEQQRIAKALSDVDALINTTEKLLQKKKNIKQGAMQNLLTGKKRLPGFAKSNNTKMTELGEIPEDWEVKRLGEICDLINGDRSSKYPKDDEMVSNGIPFINAGHLKEGTVDFDEMDYITRNHYQSLSGAKIREGDILFCLRGSLGKNALVDFNDGAPASSLCVIRHKTINEKLLFQIINSSLFEKQIIDANSGSSQPNLSAKEVSNFLIPIPTSKEEQTAIANVLSSMDKEIETLNTKLEKYRNLKTAMMQQLLTGKIRLVN